MNRKWVCTTACLVSALAILTAAGCEPPPIQPTTIKYDEDVCAECQEAIRDRRFAAQYALPGGMVKKFDDPGCLVRAFRSEPVAPKAAHFQDFLKDRWLHDKEAWFAPAPKGESPHGYGWAVYGSFGDAQDAVTTGAGGQILPFEQAKDRIARGAAQDTGTPR
jgi:hypothetical protein